MPANPIRLLPRRRTSTSISIRIVEGYSRTFPPDPKSSMTCRQTHPVCTPDALEVTFPLLEISFSLACGSGNACEVWHST